MIQCCRHADSAGSIPSFLKPAASSQSHALPRVPCRTGGAVMGCLVSVSPSPPSARMTEAPVPMMPIVVMCGLLRGPALARLHQLHLGRTLRVAPERSGAPELHAGAAARIG